MDQQTITAIANFVGMILAAAAGRFALSYVTKAGAANAEVFPDKRTASPKTGKKSTQEIAAAKTEQAEQNSFWRDFVMQMQGDLLTHINNAHQQIGELRERLRWVEQRQSDEIEELRRLIDSKNGSSQ